MDFCRWFETKIDKTLSMSVTNHSHVHKYLFRMYHWCLRYSCEMDFGKPEAHTRFQQQWLQSNTCVKCMWACLLTSELTPRLRSRLSWYLAMRKEKSRYLRSTVLTHLFSSDTWAWPFSTRLSANWISSFTFSLVCCGMFAHRLHGWHAAYLGMSLIFWAPKLLLSLYLYFKYFKYSVINSASDHLPTAI